MSRRVLIADAHAPTRAGARAVLEKQGFTVCGEACDATTAVQLALSTRPDVCLLDTDMPGNGIAAACTILHQMPGTAVVMLAASRDDADLFDALRCGARGYLFKDIDPDQLGTAVERVLAGEATLPRCLTSRLIDELCRRDRRVPVLGQLGAQLTAREWDVLELLLDAATTSEIARRLFVSPVTVRTHISAILRKLHVNDRSEAIRLFDH